MELEQSKNVNANTDHSPQLSSFMWTPSVIKRITGKHKSRICTQAALTVTRTDDNNILLLEGFRCPLRLDQISELTSKPATRR